MERGVQGRERPVEVKHPRTRQCIEVVPALDQLPIGHKVACLQESTSQRHHFVVFELLNECELAVVLPGPVDLPLVMSWIPTKLRPRA